MRGFCRKGKGIVGSSQKRQREMDIWEAGCRAALQQVYWQGVEAMGRWAVDTLQWRERMRQHQWNWDPGWLQYRAPGEAAKLWAPEGDQVLIIVCWQIRVPEHSAKPGGSRASPASVDPNRSIRGAGPGHGPGDGTPNGRGAGWAGGNPRQGRVGTCVGRGSGQEEARTAAGTSVVGGGEGPPTDRMGEGTRTPREVQCCIPQYRWGHKHLHLEGLNHQCTAHSGNTIWPEIFLNCSTACQSSNGVGQHKTASMGSPKTGQRVEWDW